MKKFIPEESCARPLFGKSLICCCLLCLSDKRQRQDGDKIMEREVKEK